jgi:cytochrome c5
MLLTGTFCAAPSIGAPPGYERDTRAYNLAHGRVVFTDKCMGCHESGRKGAPVFGDTADWADRLTQPLDTLIAHAIGGHGRMPARGDQDLSDQDVAAAVAYVVNRIRVMAAARGDATPWSSAQSPPEQAVAPSDYAVMHMFLLLIGKEQWR